MEMVTEAIARSAFSGTDQIKVASQYKTFVDELKTLETPEEKAGHYLQGIKYLLSNKSSYWILSANMLSGLMEGDIWTFAVPKSKRDKITKKDFIETNIGITQRYCNELIRIARNYKKVGLKEKDVLLLGVKDTAELITKSFKKKRELQFHEIETVIRNKNIRKARLPRYTRVFNSIKKLKKQDKVELKKLLKNWGFMG